MMTYLPLSPPSSHSRGPSPQTTTASVPSVLSPGRARARAGKVQAEGGFNTAQVQYHVLVY